MMHEGWVVTKLLHSLNIVAVGLSIGNEIKIPNWLVLYCCVIISKYRLGTPDLHWIKVSCNALWTHMTGGNFHHFKDHWQSPCTAQTACSCLPLGLCTETLKESRMTGKICRGKHSHDTIKEHTNHKLNICLFKQVINGLSPLCND